MKRRDFLKYSGLVFLSSLMPFGMKGWAAGVASLAQLNVTRKKLIVLFQRGAVDGLSLVIPHNESFYYDERPTIAIPPPGTAGGALALNTKFGLHPALSPIFPLWRSKTLAFIHACGSPSTTRSHFEAQNFIESGSGGEEYIADGWLNRLLETLSGAQKDIQGISLGSVVPKIMKGKLHVVNIPSNPAIPIVTDQVNYAKHFNELYEHDAELNDLYHYALESRKKLLIALKEELDEANNGAPAPSSFKNNCMEVAKLMARDPTFQIAFLDVGGWDTHANQGGTSGNLASNLSELGEGVLALTKGLGETYQDTLIIVLSEFGRTVRENSNGGTDHGHGNVMWVLGGAIEGRKIYGEWPGLTPDTLHENRDLAITTDYRDAIANLIKNHFNLTTKDLGYIFPKFQTSTAYAKKVLDGLWASNSTSFI